eukprot:EC815202.1.p1 GENE.EC815202.1~~EC815202.1.p1  ORF type:complete len:169 (+),score=33.28 EC815202.1:58-564(+)
MYIAHTRQPFFSSQTHGRDRRATRERDRRTNGRTNGGNARRSTRTTVAAATPARHHAAAQRRRRRRRRANARCAHATHDNMNRQRENTRRHARIFNSKTKQQSKKRPGARASMRMHAHAHTARTHAPRPFQECASETLNSNDMKNVTDGSGIEDDAHTQARTHKHRHA